jgi:hypothetical protein
VSNGAACCPTGRICGIDTVAAACAGAAASDAGVAVVETAAVEAAVVLAGKDEDEADVR